MPRINVNDTIESQEEFWRLMSLVKDRDAALGKLVRFFRIAQHRYGHREVMTRDDLEARELLCMIESGWAIPAENGFRCKGEDEQFGWYRTACDQGKHGKKGGKPKKRESNEISEVANPPPNPRGPPSFSFSFSFYKY